MTNINLWIDDERPMPDGYSHWAKTSDEAIGLLDIFRSRGDVLVSVSFDHDLGYTGDQDDNSRRIAIWMSEHGVWPELVIIHTRNPIGASWLYRHFAYDGPEGMSIIRAPFDPKNYQ